MGRCLRWTGLLHALSQNRLSRREPCNEELTRVPCINPAGTGGARCPVFTARPLMPWLQSMTSGRKNETSGRKEATEKKDLTLSQCLSCCPSFLPQRDLTQA